MKNIKCRGCEYYTIGGPRRCKAIKQTLYERFKLECPCIECRGKKECVRKASYIIKCKFPNAFVSLKLEICEIFNDVIKTFKQSFPNYEAETSYRDNTKWWEHHRIITQCTPGVIRNRAQKI